MAGFSHFGSLVVEVVAQGGGRGCKIGGEWTIVDAIRCDTTRCNWMRCEDVRYDAMRYNDMRCDTVICDSIR